MSQSGQIIFYRNCDPLDLSAAFLSLIKFLDIISISSITRTMQVDESWAKFNQGKDDIFPDEESLSAETGIFDIPKFFYPNLCTKIEFQTNDTLNNIYKDIEKEIPPSIRGEFSPSTCYIFIGDHDLFEFSENENGFLFGRPNLSILFWGYSSPNDWYSYKKILFDIPKIRLLKNKLESILGILNQCAYWTV